MVNTRRKGNRIERKCEKQLQNHGLHTARMPHTRYGDNDHFQLYDIIAMKPEAAFKMVQVKSNSPPNLQNFKKKALEKTPLKHAQIEIWVHHDRTGWKIRRLNRVNKEWDVIIDETTSNCKIGEKITKEKTV